MQLWNEAGAGVNEDPSREASQRYAQALGAALLPVILEGVTQRVLARETHNAPSTVSRYLKGQRIAPREFVNALAALLARHEQPLTPAQLDNLHSLRREAQKSSRSVDVRLLNAREQIEELELLLAAAQEQRQDDIEQVRRESSQQLEDVERRLASLTAELAEALTRAQTAEADRGRLQATVDEQENRLRHAGELVRVQDSELIRQQNEVQLLQQETKALRRQIGKLTEEEVPDPSTLVNRVATSTSRERRGGAESSGQTGTTTGSASEQAVDRPLRQPSAWAQPGWTDRFMQELRRLSRESRIPDDPELAKIAQKLRTEDVKATSLPDINVSIALVEAFGGDPLQWETDWRNTNQRSKRWNAWRRPPGTPRSVPVKILAGVIGSVSYLPAPVFVYLNTVAYIAVCRAEHEYSFAVVMGLIVIAMVDAAFTAFGLIILNGVASIVKKRNSLDDNIVMEIMRGWSMIGSAVALVCGVVLPVAAGLGKPGIWWAHALGVG